MKFDDLPITPQSWSFEDIIGRQREWTPRRKPRTVTASANVNPLDDLILVDCTAGAVTLTLETCVGCDGRQHSFKKIDSSSNAMIIAGASGETIDAAASVNTTVQYITFWLKSRGTTDWASVILQSGAAPGGVGTVTSVTWTGGIVTVANGTTTPAFTVAGTSGGIPYFDSATSWGSSGVLTANRIVLGGGAATTPAVLGSLGTTTTLLHGNAAGAPTFGAVVTTDITDANITYAKIQNVTANKLLGRETSGAGVVEEITLGTNLSLTGTTLNAASSSSTPGGSDTQVQFNDSSAFGGDADFTWNKTTNVMTVGSVATPTVIAGGDGSSSAGAAITVKGGTGNGTGIKVGGNATLTGGTGAPVTTSGHGGLAILKGGPAGSAGGTGGTVQVLGGDKTGNNLGGAVQIAAGDTANQTAGVDVTITGGNGNGGSTNGGGVVIAGGAGAQDGGAVSISGGTASGGTGGSITLTAKNGVGTNKTGGSVTITAGNKSGSGTDGLIILAGADRVVRINGQTTGGGASLGTLTNSPAVGDPTFWLKVNIGGTNYLIPCWAG